MQDFAILRCSLGIWMKCRNAQLFSVSVGIDNMLLMRETTMIEVVAVVVVMVMLLLLLL